MRVVLVGCGAMAEGWLTAILRSPLLAGKLELVGLVDTQIEAATQLAAKFDLTDTPLSDNLQHSIDTHRPDAVFDVTTPQARPTVVRQALNAGLHVLAEKPMAPTLQDAQQLAALADDKDLLYVITQNRRYKEGIRRAQAFLASGAIGEITGLHADFFIGARFGGFRDQMDHVLLLDMAIHTFDGARFLSGQEPEAVYCHESNPQGSWYAHGSSAFATFEMTGGVVFSYRGSWCAEGANTAWDSTWRITGSNGTLLWDGENTLIAHTPSGDTSFLRDTVEITVPPLAASHKAQEHASVIADFLHAVANKHRPETDSADNIKSIAMVFAAIDSAKQGRRISINPTTRAV